MLQNCRLDDDLTNVFISYDCKINMTVFDVGFDLHNLISRKIEVTEKFLNFHTV